MERGPLFPTAQNICMSMPTTQIQLNRDVTDVTTGGDRSDSIDIYREMPIDHHARHPWEVKFHTLAG